MAGPYVWRDRSEIERWVEDYRFEVAHRTFDFAGKDDPIDELRHMLARGDFANRNKQSVEAYLAEWDRKAHRISDQGQADREERALDAAERSAGAAERSARWAGWAIVVSLAALAIAGWPYIRDWLQ